MPWPTFKALRIGRPASKDDLLELVNREVMPLLKQLRDWLMSIQGTTQGSVWTLEDDGAGGVTPTWSHPGAGLWLSGTGSPEGAVTASVGVIYLRTDGGAGTTLYVKESGTGDTGWVGK